jgi:hypothetical protein
MEGIHGSSKCHGRKYQSISAKKYNDASSAKQSRFVRENPKQFRLLWKAGQFAGSSFPLFCVTGAARFVLCLAAMSSFVPCAALSKRISRLKEENNLLRDFVLLDVHSCHVRN